MRASEVSVPFTAWAEEESRSAGASEQATIRSVATQKGIKRYMGRRYLQKRVGCGPPSPSAELSGSDFSEEGVAGGAAAEGALGSG